MARRTSRTRTPAPVSARPAEGSPCLCGSGQEYGACCGPLHAGHSAAPTAERLMRSRYAAFARHDADYLLRTWDASTRPPRAELRFDPALRWTGLEILGATDGGPFHSAGTVEFRAHWTDAGGPGVLHELSRFRRDPAGAWVYLDGDIREAGGR